MTIESVPDNIHWLEVKLLHKNTPQGVRIEDLCSCYVLRGASIGRNDALINWSSSDANMAQTWLKNNAVSVKK